MYGLNGQFVPVFMTRRYGEPVPARSNAKDDRLPLRKDTSFDSVCLFCACWLGRDYLLRKRIYGCRSPGYYSHNRCAMTFGQLVSALSPFLAPYAARRRGNEMSLPAGPLITAVASVPAFLIPHWAAVAIAIVVVLGTASV